VKVGASDRALRRRIGVLVCAIVLLDSLFFAALTPMLPYYRDRFGLSGSAIGVLSGAYAAGTLIGSVPSGWLGARIGPRRTVLVGLSLMSLASLLFAFGDHIVVLDAARFVQGLAGACSWVGALGWLLSLTPASERGTAIGQVMGLGFAGALAGPALGALARGIGPEVPFSAIAGAGVLLALTAVRAPLPPPQRGGSASLVDAVQHDAVRIGMAFMFLPAFVAGSMNVLNPLRLDRLGASGLAIGATFLAAAAAQAMGQVSIGRLADRVGPCRPILGALSIGAVLLLTLPLPNRVSVLAVLIVGATLAFGVVYTPATAVLAHGAASVGLDEALGLALVNITWAGGQMVGALAAGGMADATSQWAPCLLLSTIGAAGAVGLWWARYAVPDQV
jgi:predicted MFS family arabinose efflux permease